MAIAEREHPNADRSTESVVGDTPLVAFRSSTGGSRSDDVVDVLRRVDTSCPRRVLRGVGVDRALAR